MSTHDVETGTPAAESGSAAARGGTSRRRLLEAGGVGLLGAGVLGLTGCMGDDDDEPNAAAPAGATTAGGSSSSSGDSILDKWTREKTAKLGVDLSFPPLQFKDDSGKPTGYQVEITELMMKELGVTPEYVETPFAQLFPGLSAGKFDMLGIAVTILPSRALRGDFADIPAFYESNVVVVKKDSNASTLEDLATSKFAVLQGSSQAASSGALFPKATFNEFASENDAATEVAVGRADAAIFSEFSTSSVLGGNDDLAALPVPPLFVDANSYFMTQGDTKLWLWVSNWARYQASHGTFKSLWEKWVVPNTEKFDLQTAVVGINGNAETIGQ
ncbi:MAG: substrate-binding periplasmic protein [Gaiellaceae bacterium]